MQLPLSAEYPEFVRADFTEDIGAFEEEKAPHRVRHRVIFGSAIIFWALILWAILSLV